MSIGHKDGVLVKLPATIRNMSVNGAFIETRALVKVGSILHLRFTLGGREVTCSAIVRHSTIGRGLGVEFLVRRRGRPLFERDSPPDSAATATDRA